MPVPPPTPPRSSPPGPASGPWRLAQALTAWAERQPWIDWVELGGSLGRGAGDEQSDVDAGIGFVPEAMAQPDAIAQVGAALAGFGPLVDTLLQTLPGTHALPHLIAVYADGRQLSLVVMPAPLRDGLPPGAMALLDRTGRLATPLPVTRYDATADQRREWAFMGWIALGDTVRHAGRGRLWRALRTLTEAREAVWRLHAAALGVPYPAFAEVSVENASLAPPPGLAATLPAALTTDALLTSARALAPILHRLATDLDVTGLAAMIERQLHAPPPARPGASGRLPDADARNG